MHTKTARARGKVRAQYRWAYDTSTLIPLQENGQNQHEKGGWAFNTSWAYNTYSTVYARSGEHVYSGIRTRTAVLELLRGQESTGQLWQNILQIVTTGSWLCTKLATCLIQLTFGL